MPNSYAQSYGLTCPKCRQRFVKDVYLIVNINERPDLLERIRQGDLHRFFCPHCTYQEQIDAPLLIFRPDERPHILFSPAEGTSQAEDERHANQLIQHLKISLPTSWHEEWLKDDLSHLQRPVLTALVSEDPEAALQALTEQEDQDLENLKVNDPENYMERLVKIWLDARSMNEKQRILEKRPEILDEEAENVLQSLLKKAIQNRNNQLVDFLQLHRILLIECRKNGVAVAIKDFERKSTGQQRLSDELRIILTEVVRPTLPSDMPRRIELCRQALSMTTRETQGVVWAILQRILGDSFRQNPVGDQAENFEQAIYHYHQALEIITQQDLEIWLDIQNDLGTVYLTRTHAERMDNVEQAIHHFKRTLEVVTQQNDPKRWARSQNNLASAYNERIGGDRAENIERSIYHFHQALEVRTRQNDPEQWMKIQASLADVYRIRLSGERAENLEQAIYHYQQALTVLTRENFPADWAGIHNNLAIAYSDRIRGSREESIEEAIYHYQLALEVTNRQDFPKEWAATQMNLGGAYSKRIRGERAENLEQAIYHYNQTLEVRTQQSYPKEWADTQHNLASVFVFRIYGERAENIEQAIHYCQRALEVRTQQDCPEDWARTLINLAIAYAARIQGDRAENLEQAVRLHHQVLQILTLEVFPESWARTQNNLAIAYLYRIRGDRAENLEQSIYHFKQAIQVYTRQAFPADWAMVQNNLALSYAYRVLGSWKENSENAVYHFQQALEVRIRQDFPEDWATTQNNLAMAYLRLGEADKENIEKALYHCQQALEIYTRQAFPADWAMTQHNLATAYSARIHGDHDQNLEQAIFHYEQALEVRTQQSYPKHWADTQHNLAIAYTDRVLGDKEKNMKQAIYHFQQVLKVATSNAFPSDNQKSSKALGNLAYDGHHWKLARDAYNQALVAQELLIQTSFTRSGKETELREMQTIPSRMAHVHVQLGQVERAVEVLEQGRAQLLRESLERQRRDLEQLPALGFQRLYEDYKQILDQYNNLQILAETKAERQGDWLPRIDSTVDRLQRVAAAIREEAGKKYVEYRYFLQALPFAEIQKLAIEKPLVYLSVTSAGGLALIVKKDGVTPLSLPALTEDALRIQIYGTANGISRGGYLTIYANWLDNLRDEKAREAWLNQLDETTRWLWNVLMEKLIDELANQYSSVTLIPMGLLSLLPLHAAWHEDETQPTGRRYILDELNINYTPSTHALWQASLASECPTENVILVDNPDGTLVFSNEEVQAVLEGFRQVMHLRGKDARIEVVKEAMQNAHVLHFSTHATAGWQKAEQAHLNLADGDLTLSDIFRLQLDQPRLAVLSACETGIPGLDLIEEMIGLPSGMMQAGVPGVIGSLWAVNDMSTAMLMARFYSLWRENGIALQEALRQAQIWLRDSTTTEKKQLFKHFMERQTLRMSNETVQAFYQHIGWDDPDMRVFASPYYWAAFTYTGV